MGLVWSRKISHRHLRLEKDSMQPVPLKEPESNLQDILSFILQSFMQKSNSRRCMGVGVEDRIELGVFDAGGSSIEPVSPKAALAVNQWNILLGHRNNQSSRDVKKK